MWGFIEESWAIQLVGKNGLFCQPKGIWWDVLKMLFLIIVQCYCSACVMAVWPCPTCRWPGRKVPVTMQSLFCFVSAANKRETSQRDLRVVVISRQRTGLCLRIGSLVWLCRCQPLHLSLSPHSEFLGTGNPAGNWQGWKISKPGQLFPKSNETHILCVESFCLLGAVLPPSPVDSNLEKKIELNVSKILY